MKCAPLTIPYHLYFTLCISKVSNILHHGSMGRVHSKDKNAALYWYTYMLLPFFFLFFFVLHQIFTFFIIFTCFFERVSNFCNRILINCSSETGNIQVIKNCQCNCLNGLFQKKNTRRGWGHGIFRGIEKTKCGNSTGQGEEYTGLIKKHHV